MSAHDHPCPPDRRTAELLLGGDPVIRHLLAAATAPASARELAGEEAAVAAFMAARPPFPPGPRRIDRLRSTLAKLLTVKVIAGCVAIGGAGVALAAAGTGTLPGPLHRPAPPPASVESPPAPRPLAVPPSSASPSAKPGRSAAQGAPVDPAQMCHRSTPRPEDGRRPARDLRGCPGAAVPKPTDKPDTRPPGSPTGSPTANPSGRPEGTQGPRTGGTPSGAPETTRAGP
jgi:hypothetical protein